MSVLPGEIRTADASGNVRAAGMSGVGFCVVPMGNGAAFPVTVRLDNSAEQQKNPTINTLATIVEADGFDELELRGAAPGSKWTIVVLTDPADEYRPGPATLLLQPPKPFNLLYDFTLGSIVSNASNFVYAVDFQNGALVNTGVGVANYAGGSVPGLDLSAYSGFIFSARIATMSAATSVFAYLFGRNGTDRNDPVIFEQAGSSASGGIATGAAMGFKATLSGPATFTESGLANCKMDVVGASVPIPTFLVGLGVSTTHNNLRFQLWGIR